jgi:tetratricopeptide (TPR) repeat protein
LAKKMCLQTTFAAIILAVGLNCGSSRQAITISMSSELKNKGSQISAAWFGYGAAKALWRTKTFFEKNPGTSTYSYSMPEEVDCRESLAKMWLEMKDKDSATDEYLDDLSAVHKAGYMVEYVWKFFRQADWTAPGGLREEAYGSWAQENIRNHKCITLSLVYSEEDEKATPRAQQEMISKAVGDIASGRYGSAESLLRQVVSRVPANWQACSEAGDTIFCHFWDIGEKTECAKENPKRTVVPVFPSYSRAFYLLGFIAIEKGDAELALSQLDKASLLQPDHPVILLEKGGALSKLGRSEEAYQCFVRAEKPHFASTTLVLARALRGQGISLIDLGRLDEAEVCLDKSLEYDPESKTALNEMEYIRWLRSGEARPGAEIKMNKVKK